ncbi:MAG: hypothetical protein QN183_00685 [Armatimonadota bacterium]|nr:hypothetical protein [Armatimonadota bacterium]MDR7486159.1 hypothetical protein [Armatimonadota bacterium]MDR7531790.1 hypothetical protein [Armatimonadota bacterium]MDR7534865.1 hypothetical protein [Armatimonadota bacterium]
MVTREELQRLVGRRATLALVPGAPGGPIVTGRVLGVLDALDGAVVTVEPEGTPGARQTIHYHHIAAATPVDG